MSSRSLLLFSTLSIFVLLPIGQTFGQNMANTTTRISNDTSYFNSTYFQHDGLTLQNGSVFNNEDATCDPGELAIGGGYDYPSSEKGLIVTEDRPIKIPPPSSQDGWLIGGINSGAHPVNITVWVLCYRN